MKKLFGRIVLGIVALFLVLLLVVFLSLGRIVKKGIETVGPLATKTSVTLGFATIGPLTGRGVLRNVVVGNPSGFKSPVAISVDRISVRLQPRSLFTDTVRIREIIIDQPEIDYEAVRGNTNLDEIQRNVETFAGASSAEPAGKAGKKLSIELIQIRNGKIHYSSVLTGKEPKTLVLPDLEIKNLGVGSQGVRPAEVASKVFESVLRNTVRAVAEGSTSSLKSRLRKLFGRK